MRFSDIHMIMIGEEGEYGRRLVRYLETHLSTAIRVYHFTTTESFLAFKERADIYLLDGRERGGKRGHKNKINHDIFSGL